MKKVTWWLISQVLELACARESEKVYGVGALPAMMALIIDHSGTIYKDTLSSCMTIISRLMSRVEPKDPQLKSCVASLSLLLQHSDPNVSDTTARCTSNITVHVFQANKFTKYH